MPDWTAPFSIPDLTNEDYERQKAEYHAQHGYTITIPALEDVLKIPMEKPISAEEHERWKAKDYDYFSAQRLAEMRQMKAKRVANYQRFLADPSPKVVRNFQSIMTALDDAQDALNTVGAVGMLAKKAAPRALSRLLTGPVGVVMTAADVLNLIASVPMMCMLDKKPKRAVARYTECNPFTKKGRVKYAKKLRNWKPSSADVIQGLQTTDQVFGFGISLGPLVGLPISLASGAARAIQGEEVKIKFAPWDWKHWQKVAMKFTNSMGVLWGMPHSTDDMELVQSLTAYTFSNQALFDHYQNWNPLDAIEDLDVIEIEAPRAENILTQEAITEGGHTLDDGIGWPSVNKQIASLAELHETIPSYAIDNLVAHLKRMRQNWYGWSASESASNSALYTLGILEGKEMVEFDYTCAQKLSQRVIESRQTIDPLTPYSTLQLFADELGALDALGECVEPQDLQHVITSEALPRIVPLPQPT
ncbi:MAG: hypothetical protein ACFE9A_19015 [Candidatus Hodarchaeota archaeon]